MRHADRPIPAPASRPDQRCTWPDGVHRFSYSTGRCTRCGTRGAPAKLKLSPLQVQTLAQAFTSGHPGQGVLASFEVNTNTAAALINRGLLTPLHSVNDVRRYWVTREGARAVGVDMDAVVAQAWDQAHEEAKTRRPCPGCHQWVAPRSSFVRRLGSNVLHRETPEEALLNHVSTQHLGTPGSFAHRAVHRKAAADWLIGWVWDDAHAENEGFVIRCLTHGHLVTFAGVTGTTWSVYLSAARWYPDRESAEVALDRARWLDHVPQLEALGADPFELHRSHRDCLSTNCYGRYIELEYEGPESGHIMSREEWNASVRRDRK